MTDDSPALLRQIATSLRVRRHGRGVTREQLAEQADVDAQMIKRIESGRANPALVTLSRLASALAISLSLLLGGDASADPAIAPAPSEAEAFESEAVGDTIAALRKHRHLSRRAFAKLIDVRAITLRRYESATADIRLLGAGSISRVLGIGTADLVRAIEQRQRDADHARGAWFERAAGVRCRLVAAAGRSQLWEWRLAPAVSYVEEPPVGVEEEIATAIRGDVRVEVGDAFHQLRRGGSVSLPAGHARRLQNTGRSTARLLRFQVSK